MTRPDRKPRSTTALREQSVSGAKWIAVQKWYSKLVGLVTTLVLARLLAPAEFGLVAFAMAFISVASVLTEAGLTPSIVQSKGLSRTTASTAFWVSIMIAVVSVGIMQLIAAPIATVLRQPELEPILRVLSLLMIVTAFSSVQMALLNRELEMRSLALRQFVSVTAGAVAGIVSALVGLGAWSLVVQSLGGAVVGVIVLWASTSWRPQLVFSRSAAQALLRAGVAVLGTNLVHQIRDRGDEFLIGGILGAEFLGYWTVGTRLTKTAVDLFYSVISGISFPVLTRVAGERDRFARGVEFGLTLNLFFMFPTLVGLAVATPVLIPTLFGQQWIPAVPSALIYALAISIGVVQWLDSQIWWSLGRFRTELSMSTAISAVHITTVAIAAPFGLVAVATAVLLRTCLTAPARLVLLMRRTDLSIRVYRNVPRIVAAVLVMAALSCLTLVLTSSWPPVAATLVVVAVEGLTYFGASVLIQRRTVGLVLSLLSPRFARFNSSR